MSTNSASKKPKTAAATTYEQNWFFTSPECIPKWHRLVGNRWFIEALNEKLSYANGNAARDKLKSLLNFHDTMDASQLTMPELDAAHMFVLTRNETTLGYFSCADVWKYDERSAGGSASPFVKMLEQKADLLIKSAINASPTIDWFEENDYLVNTNNSSWDMNGERQNENLSMLAYTMVYNDHHHFLSVFLHDPRVLEVWADSSNFNVWEMDENMDDGETHLGSTLLKQACEVDAYQSARLLVNFRHRSINSNSNSVDPLPAKEGGLVFNPFDTCEFRSNGVNSTTSNGMSAVHIACWHGSVRTLRVLLEAPLFDGVVGRTHHWQSKTDEAMLEKLPINRTNDSFYGWQQNCCSAMGITPLHAILLGATKSKIQNIREGVQMLINFGADVNAVSGPVTNNPPHQSDAVFCEGNGNRQCYMTPLHLASLTGDPLLVNMLLAAGASANAVSGHECLSFGKTTNLIFKPRDHCIKASYCSISTHRRGWTPTTMAVHSLSCEPTSSNRRVIAETLTAAMSSTSTLQFPPPTNEYDQGGWNKEWDESDKTKWNVEINYPKWIKRVDRDCPDVLQMFKPVEDVTMKGTEDTEEEVTHEDAELTGIFSTPAALPSQPLPAEWLDAFDAASNPPALPTLAASIRTVLVQGDLLGHTSIRVDDKALNGVLRLVVNAMKPVTATILSGGDKTAVRESLIKHMRMDSDAAREAYLNIDDFATPLLSPEGPAVDVTALLKCCDITASNDADGSAQPTLNADAVNYFGAVFQNLVVLELLPSMSTFAQIIELPQDHLLLKELEFAQTFKTVFDFAIFNYITGDSGMCYLFIPSAFAVFGNIDEEKDYDEEGHLNNLVKVKALESIMKHGCLMKNKNEEVAKFYRKILLSGFSDDVCSFDDMVMSFFKSPSDVSEGNFPFHPFFDCTYGLLFSGQECAIFVDSIEREVKLLQNDDVGKYSDGSQRSLAESKKYSIYTSRSYAGNTESWSAAKIASHVVLNKCRYLMTVHQNLLTSGLLPTDGLKQRGHQLLEILKDIETVALTPVVEDPDDKIPIETICLQLADICQMRSEYDMAIALYQHVLSFPTHTKAAQCGIAEVHCHCGRLDDALAAFACIE